MSTVNFVTNLTFGIVDQNPALPTFDINNQIRNQSDNHTDDDSCQCAHGTGTNQLDKTTDGIWQTGSNTRKDDHRNTVSKTSFRDLFAEPHQEHGTGHQRDNRRKPESHARINHQTRLGFECHRNTKSLECCKNKRSITGVLRHLSSAGFAFFFQCINRRRYNAQHLHDNRSRNVRHNAKGKDRKTRECATREHVEHAEDTALVLIEQQGKLFRINTRNRDMRTDAEYYQCSQQKE